MDILSKIVGILNLTPDSFFDGGKYNVTSSALLHLQELLANGADVIDVGAESTRPNAIPIDADEEWLRLKDILPVIIQEVQKYNQKSGWQQSGKRVEVSLDSRHWQNVVKAVDLGIDIINDVSGFEDEQMIKLAVQSGKKIVVMHNLGVPADKNKIIPENLDVIKVLIDWMKNKLEILLKAGVQKSQIIFDVGIGFGKNSLQSIKILQEIDRLRELDLPLYVGHSNKSFLDDFSSDVCLSDSENRAREVKSSLLFRREGGCLSDSENRAREVKSSPLSTREEKTILVSKYLIQKNIEYLRVHDVIAYNRINH
jgi:dihydropteroate synthase